MYAIRSYYASVLYFNPNAMDNNTNFINEIKNNNAMMQNYNVSLSGGNKSLTYNINSNYFNQDGILINSRITSYNVCYTKLLRVAENQ